MPSEVPDRHELRAKVIHALGVDARDAAVRAEAVKRVEAWEQDRTTLDPTLVGAVLAIVAHGGDAKRWDDFKARMDAANDPEDRDHFMGALTAFEDPALIQKSLELAHSRAASASRTWRASSGTCWTTARPPPRPGPS